MIKYLGSLVGYIEGAIDLVIKLENQINLIKKKNTKLKPKVYFEEWDDPYISAIGWVSEIIEIAGGVDIFSERSKDHKSKVRSVSSNEVICKNPDIIFASWCGKKVNFKKMKERNGWESINAIKTNSLFEIKSPIILQPGPAAITDGLLQINYCIENWKKKYSYYYNLIL